MTPRALKTPPALAQAWAPLQAQWRRLAAREQTLVLLAGALVALALLWWLLLAPALLTWKTSAARHAQVDAQLQQMLQLQAEAQQLQQAPRAPAVDALAALRGATGQLLGDGARLVIAGEQATVTLQQVPAEALARWLAQVRAQAHATPLQARLTRSSAPGAAPAWDGTLVLALPPG
ncbi:general secretion pathway protein M [Oryzisolibacter propanilivorax]|uniref:General secretion pathway protein M n=1 Tax=Oryzisolibacter propanilivorax TaxID=1527607 RepID=A0A1G9VB45_9BURK|nr:type II secretion system protein GspM [Oryzisolibacter propanilivorax]SDM69361.1 general secretion pathway protein M [Oryzisolibacter propanilivorax]